MAKKTLYDAHVLEGIRRFGKKAMEECNFGAVEERNSFLSVVVSNGKRMWLSTDRKNGRFVHAIIREGR